MSPLSPATLHNAIWDKKLKQNPLVNDIIEASTKRVYSNSELQQLRTNQSTYNGALFIINATLFSIIKRSENQQQPDNGEMRRPAPFHRNNMPHGGAGFTNAMQLPMFNFRPGTNFNNSHSVQHRLHGHQSPNKSNQRRGAYHPNRPNHPSTKTDFICRDFEKMIRIDLGREVKLSEAENAWKPSHLQKEAKVDVAAVASAADAINDLKKQVRSILNKLTKQNFDALSDLFQKLPIDTNDKMDEVIKLVFDKAVDEPNFSECYAHLCNYLSKHSMGATSVDHSSFKRTLIEKLQKEFEQNVANQNTIEAGLKPLKERLLEMQAKGDAAGTRAAKESIADEESRIRRRLVSTVQFLGELFKLDMLTPRIMNMCVQTLILHGTDEKLECACKLLTTIGQKLEQTRVDKTKMNDLSTFMAKLKLITERKTNKIQTRTK